MNRPIKAYITKSIIIPKKFGNGMKFCVSIIRGFLKISSSIYAIGINRITSKKRASLSIISRLVIVADKKIIPIMIGKIIASFIDKLKFFNFIFKYQIF